MIDIPNPRQPGDKEYRCTLPELYPKPADGHRDPSKRQGYYVYAKNEAGACEIMQQRFPSAKQIDVEEWKPKGE